jgi:diketogulonate reductase-like aldo/keto reductase
MKTFEKEIPSYFYGTAWKEDDTAELVKAALVSGFRAIDTANQRKHYHEEGAGQGIAQFLKESGVKRDELFIQTKFTYARGQDHRKPYDESHAYEKQVTSSFASSLEHLKTDYIDSYILHGPYSILVGDEDHETWSAMEGFVHSGQAGYLGVSNVGPQQLLAICEYSKVKPHFVQNRCFARLGWDREIREICQSHNILYQGFSLLTANQYELQHEEITRIAKKYGKTIPQIIFKFSHQLGIICLTGTTQMKHMQDNLSIGDFELTKDELLFIENIAF